MKATPLKQALGYIYLHTLSCYDKEFQKNYRTYAERKRLADEKIKEIEEKFSSDSFAMQMQRRRDVELQIVLKGSVKKAEKRLQRQVHFRICNIDVIRNTTILLEKITQINILKGQYKNEIINPKQYYEALDDIDTKFKKINDQFRKKEKNIQGQIMTRSQRGRKIEKIILSGRMCG